MPPKPVVIGAIVAGLTSRQVVTSRITWERPRPGFFFGLVLLINSSGGLQGRSGTLAIGLRGPAVMLFTGL
jgi:hypothetical protein